MSNVLNRNQIIKRKAEISAKLTAACKVLNITEEEVISKARPRDIVNPRHFIMYWLWSQQYAMIPIAAAVGRTHPAVIHAVKKVNNLRETDLLFRDQHDQFMEEMATKNII